MWTNVTVRIPLPKYHTGTNVKVLHPDTREVTGHGHVVQLDHFESGEFWYQVEADHGARAFVPESVLEYRL